MTPSFSSWKDPAYREKATKLSCQQIRFEANTTHHKQALNSEPQRFQTVKTLNNRIWYLKLLYTNCSANMTRGVLTFLDRHTHGLLSKPTVKHAFTVNL